MSLNTLLDNTNIINDISLGVSEILNLRLSSVNSVTSTTFNPIFCTNLVDGSQNIIITNETDNNKARIIFQSVLQDSSGVSFTGNHADDITVEMRLNGSTIGSLPITSGASMLFKPLPFSLSKTTIDLTPNASSVLNIKMPVTTGGVTPNRYYLSQNTVVVESYQ